MTDFIKCSLLVLFYTLYFLEFTKGSNQVFDRSTKANKNRNYIGGLSLSDNGRLYEVSSQECPGGIFLTRPINETCLCFNGIFAVVRDCCISGDENRITTESLEWRQGYQCGISPEIGDPGPNPIKAILPLTKWNKPFQSVLTFTEFSGEDVKNWRKFDLMQLSSMYSKPLTLAGTSEVEIINIKPLKNPVRLLIGKFGDVPICYSGWITKLPQSIRISVNIYVKEEHEEDCCFQITELSVPGEVTSNCLRGSVLTEIVDIESVNSGFKSCPNEISETPTSTGSKRVKRAYDTKMDKGNSPGTQPEMYSIPIQSGRKRPSNPVISAKNAPIQLEINPSDPVTPNIISPDFMTPIPIPNGPSDPESQTEKTPTYPDPDTPVVNPDLPTDPNNPNPMGSTLITGISNTTDDSKSLQYSLREVATDTYYNQNRKIMVFNMIRDRGLSMANKRPVTQRFVLLRKCVDIIEKIVPEEMVPKTFFETGFNSFFYLFENLDKVGDTVRNIGVGGRLDALQYQRTLKGLMSCESKLESRKRDLILYFREDSCPPEVDRFSYTFTNGTVLEKTLIPMPPVWLQFRKDRHDPMTEMMWKVVDFVYTMCFDEFVDDFNAHHFYENQMELLFLQTYVQKRWSKNTDKSNKDIYKPQKKNSIPWISKILPNMVSLDKAVGVAHFLSNKKEYLHRPLKDTTLSLRFSNYKALLSYEQAIQQKLEMEMKEAENEPLDGEGVGELSDLFKTEAPLIKKKKPKKGNLKVTPIDADAGTPPPVNRERKHIESSKNKNNEGLLSKSEVAPMRSIIKPGDTIWDGLAVCLNANFNDDLAYYSDDTKWGTQPDLIDLDD